MDQDKTLQRNIRLYYLYGFLSNLAFNIPIWVSFQRRFLTFTQMSLIAAAQILIALIMELPTGAFADMFGRKKSVLVGCFFYGIGFLRIGTAHNGIHILLGLLLTGLGDSFISGADVAFLFDHLKKYGKEKLFPKIRGNASLIAQFGIITSSIVAGYMYSYMKGLPYFALVATYILTALTWMLMREEKVKKNMLTVHSYFEHTISGIKHAFKVGFTRDVSIFYVFVGGFSWIWQSFLNQIYASNIGYSEIGKGILFAIIRFVNVILILRLLRFDKYLTKKNVFIFFPILLLISSLPAVIPSIGVGTALLFMMTMSSTLRFVVLDGYVNEEFDSHYRATALSSLNMSIRILYIFSIVLSGPVLDHFPTGVVYFIMGILTLFFILPRGISLSKHEKSQPITPAIPISHIE